MKKLLIALAFVPAVTLASEITHSFNSPAFSGIGFSSHALTIYNMELTRKLAIAAEKKADALKAEQDAKNTTMAKFISNLESRVYNELARQITEKLFEGTGTQVSGQFAFNGGNISYVKSGNNLQVTITDENGNVTTMTVPIGDFGWITP
jgi:hypothetical protein